MPDIILPSDEQILHNQLVLTTTSNAAANGVDTNSATARLSRHGQPLSGQSLYFTLSGNALFTQGGQHVTVTTDGLGEATVYFTDTRQEIVEVACHYQQTQARESSRFNETAIADRNISGEVKQNGVQANGVAQNSMLYTVYNALTVGVPNVFVDFTTTGSAVLSAQAGQTNQSGQFTLTLTNLVAEQVLVSAKVRGLIGIDNYTLLNFIQFSPQYLIIVNVTQDHAPVNQANSMNYTVITSSSGQPVPGIQLIYTAPGNIQLPPGTPTNAQGMTTLSMTSNIAGTFTITASISTEPLTHNNTNLTWGS